MEAIENKTPKPKFRYALDPYVLPEGTKLPAQILITKMPPVDPALGFANLLAEPIECWEDCVVDIKDRMVYVSFYFGDMKGETIALPFDYAPYDIRVENYYN